MSFEHGSVSLRVFKSRPGSTLPTDIVERLAKDAIPSAEAVTADGCSGWTTGRHLLDRNITEDTAVISGRVRVTLVKADKKIPGALFKAECKQEELAELAAKGVPFLRRAERKEIAAAVRERMMPSMPLSLMGVDVVSTPDGLYSTAISDSTVDLLTHIWRQSAGQEIYPYTPRLCSHLNGVGSGELNATSFSPEVDDDNMEQEIGTEFLTWMWYFSENKGGVNNEYAFALSGPFTFVHEGSGAHEIIVRKGNPGISQEAKSALMAGKKLKKAKLTVAKGEEVWTCSIDGIEWTFGSLKLPKGEAVDPVSSFEERTLSISSFVGAIEDLFKTFLAIRRNPTAWSAEVAEIRKWVADRVSQA